MPEKLRPEPAAAEALASRQELLGALPASLLAWCRDLAEASVMPPPSRRVAAKKASAVRDWVTVPRVDFWYCIILIVPQDSIATYVASGTPAPFFVIAVCWPNEA